MIKRENWARLRPGLLEKTEELAFAPITPLAHCKITEGVASGLWACFSICKMGGVKGQRKEAYFFS